jgi:predicted PolB exonuclease-like 3'-5' exonuclease
MNNMFAHQYFVQFSMKNDLVSYGNTGPDPMNGYMHDIIAIIMHIGAKYYK